MKKTDLPVNRSGEIGFLCQRFLSERISLPNAGTSDTSMQTRQSGPR